MAALAPPRPVPTVDWVAADDELEDGDVKVIEERDEAGGAKVTVSLQLDPDTGRKIKVTKRVRRTLVRSQVSSAAMARQTWASTKFGKEKGSRAGLTGGHNTTTVAENTPLKLHAGGAAKAAEPEPSAGETARSQLAGKKIQCRYCRGDHFTPHCPYKDTLAPAVGEGLYDAPGGGNPALNDPSNPAVAASAGARTGRYVPPSQREGGSRFGPTAMGGSSRDELPTLRVTNLSEEVEEDDLRQLFGRFGRVTRVFVGRDRETGRGKGFAFVSFEMFADADQARQKVDGFGYANLILSVKWSQPRGEQPAPAP